MKKWVTKILVCMAAGLLFSHQVLPHHHHEETEIAAGHHSDGHDEDDDHDTGHFPPHQITHIFSPENATVTFIKAPVQDMRAEAVPDLYFSLRIIFRAKEYPYSHIRPPLPDYYKYFSLRAPPAC